MRQAGRAGAVEFPPQPVVLVHPHSGHAHERCDASKSVKSVAERCHSWNSKLRGRGQCKSGEREIKETGERGKRGAAHSMSPHETRTLTHSHTAHHTRTNRLVLGKEFWPYAASRVVAGKAAASHSSAARQCPRSVHLVAYGGMV